MTIGLPEHEEHDQTIEWLGEEFDPEHFNPKEVNFDDPDERRRIAFEQELEQY